MHYNVCVWLPKYWFRKMYKLFRDLVWKYGVPRIKLEILQLPKGMLFQNFMVGRGG